MSTFNDDIEVAAPLAKCAAAWSNFDKFPAFMDGVESVTPIDATHQHWKLSILGAHREFDAVITEKTQTSLAWQATDGLEQGGRVDFTAVAPDVTKISVTITATPEGTLEKVGAAIGAVDAQIAVDLHNFKHLMESGEFETGVVTSADGSETTDLATGATSTGPTGVITEATSSAEPSANQ